MTRLASSRTGENLPCGMNRGGGGNIGMTRGLFATMPERADTKEAIGLNSDAPPLHSTGNLGKGGSVSESEGTDWLTYGVALVPLRRESERSFGDCGAEGKVRAPSH